ncbi:MAG: UDP-glucose 4-epimerase GalE [Planctomycetota bacterium]|nr:MAG: UDP-glucose 4-epimerase GalE [Planctomycetota bacterium]
MKLLVTGGLGYIGSHTAYLAIQEGHDVVILDNLSRGNKEALPPGAKWFSASLQNEQELDKIFRANQFDGVLHFAAYCYVGESVEKPQLYYENNLMGSLHLIHKMMEYKVPCLVLSSTAAVYGNPFTEGKKWGKITEDFPRNPMNPYGRTKATLEEILEDYQKKGKLNFISLRYFNAAGAHPEGILGEVHNPETHLIPILLQTALGKRKEAQIYGTHYPTPDGTCVRDFIHVWDLARAHLLALEKMDSFSGEAFNLGAERGYSIREVVETVKKITQVDFSVIEGPPRPGDPPYLVASSEKARELLGWSPQYSDLETIVTHAFQWFQNPTWKFTYEKIPSSNKEDS